MSVETAQSENPLYGPGEITEERFDSMPDDYKECVRSAIVRQALGEFGAGAIFSRLLVKFYEEGQAERAAHAAHLAEEESGHCMQIVSILPTVGLSTEIFKDAEIRYGEVFGGTADDLDSWEALIVFNWLAEKAGTMFLRSFTQNSYKPWRDTMESILEEEEGHEDSGIVNIRRYLKQFPENKHLIQTEIDKWFPISIKLLGVPGSPKQQMYHRYGLKAENSSVQITQYLEAVLPQLNSLGFSVLSISEIEAQGVVLPEQSVALLQTA